MTNHWNDIGNATLVVAMGANPSENHPACMAHINNARMGPHTWRDPGGMSHVTSKPAAKLIVIDPRFTRTAAQADMYVRIRPGTDIAFINGLIRYIIDNASGQMRVNMDAYLDDKSARSFLDEAVQSGATSIASMGKYTDARLLLRADDKDYQRELLVSGGKRFPNFPLRAASYSDSGTVFKRLRQHVEPYTLEETAIICGCTQSQITDVANAFMDNCRHAAYDPATVPALGGAAPIVHDPTSQFFRAGTMLYAMGITQHTVGSQNVKSFANLQSLLGNNGRCGGGINALRGIHNVQGSTDMGTLYHLIPGYSGPPPSTGATSTFRGYVNKLYGQKKPILTTFASLVTTLVGANNDLEFVAVTGGTDGNAITVRYVDPSANNAALSVGLAGDAITVNLATDGAGAITTTAQQVKDAINGNTAIGTGKVTAALASGNDGTGVVTAMAATSLAGGAENIGGAYGTGNMTHQERGFLNMHASWFMPGTSLTIDQTNVEGTFLLWPRDNGDDHIAMFRKMQLSGSGRIAAAVVWGQNPAVTEPNQSEVREGIRNLDTLVVVENFATETVMAKRKPDGVTYVIPSCAYTEEAGSVTNSGRMLQWREKCRDPRGNSKSDIELLLRFAKALNDNVGTVDGSGGFEHISDKWTSLGVTADPWTKLYGEKYGCGWAGASGFETNAVLSVEKWAVDATAPATVDASGSEAVAEKVFREYAGTQGAPVGDPASGTVWIYNGGYTAPAGGSGQITAGTWQVANRAKSRDGLDTDNVTSPGNTNPGGHRQFIRWGFAWLVNRRVLYNNSDFAFDQGDGFQGPDQCSRFFVSTNAGLIDYAQSYRHIHTMSDRPDNCLLTVTAPHVAPGRFPAHTEPYESVKAALVAKYSRNTKGGSKWDLVPGDSFLYAPDDTNAYRKGAAPQAIIDASGAYPDIATPLVITTIRCVEHFQGGPITRNNSWNVEAEPVPWIEINSADARARGINDGDWVDIYTVRGNSTTDQIARRNYTRDTGNPTDNFGRGFKARVGVGLQSNQRVGAGVVAIPWHWGDQGLSTGSCANDLCLDSFDANTRIPEYKAFVCWIKKA